MASKKKTSTKKKAAPKKTTAKAAQHVPADPIAALNRNQQDKVEKAVNAVDAAIGKAELEDASALRAARDLFEAMRHQDPFRFLIAAAYLAGKK